MNNESRKEDLRTSAKFFGTFTPPPMLSELDFHQWRSSVVNSTAGLYCNVCGQVAEVGSKNLRIYLELINLALKTAHSVETFDPTKNYILAQGCPRCSDPEHWVLSVEEIGWGHR